MTALSDRPPTPNRFGGYARNRGHALASVSHAWDMSKLSGLARAGLRTMFAVFALTGCGPTLYVTDLLKADERLEEARVANARFHAPYEYHAADAYLEKAREEASGGEYEDAIRFAQISEQLSRKAIESSRASKGAR